MELFAKVVNGWNSLTIFWKSSSSILDVWQGSEYVSDDHPSFATLLQKGQIITNWHIHVVDVVKKVSFLD